MSIARKKRGDSKLAQLTWEQQVELRDALLAGLTYDKARQMCAQDFGLTVGRSAFESFYQDVCVPEILARRERARKTAISIAADAEKRPGAFDQATTDAVQQLAFEAITRGADSEEVTRLVSLVLKMRDQELTERRIKLQEAQAAKAMEAEATLKDKTLSQEEINDKLKGIFGIRG